MFMPKRLMATAVALALSFAGAPAYASEAPETTSGQESETNYWWRPDPADYADEDLSSLLGLTTDEGGQTDSNAEGLVAQDDLADLQKTLTWTRIAGDSRYETMAQIAEQGFDASEWAVIATGESFPDALAASALAGVRKCPILLTSTWDLSESTAEQIERLGVKHAYVVGGPNTVSEYVEKYIQDMGVTTQRIAGADRVETSLKVMQAMVDAGTTVDEIAVASGANFPDALSIGPWAYRMCAPILLTQGDGTLSDQEVEAIEALEEVGRVVIVGGTGSVDESVEDQLDGYDCIRLEGKDRYATSREVAEWEMGEGLSLATPYVTTGKNFPDALAGSALCGARNSVMLVADSLDAPTLELLSENEDDLLRGFIFGGQSSFPYDDPLATNGGGTNGGGNNGEANGGNNGQKEGTEKRGYQNPEGFYQVSSKNVTITSAASEPWNYITPSRITDDATRDDCVNAFIERAREYVGSPYVWDYACAPDVGVDCIGLVYQCAYACGMDLGGGTGNEDFNPWAHYITGYSGWHSHDANNFWDYGRAMHVSLEQRMPGDVISWYGHVGIYLGDDQMIHAYSPATGVIYDSIWSYGTPRGCIRLFQ